MDPLLRVGAMKYFKHNLVDDFDLNLKSVMTWETWVLIYLNKNQEILFLWGGGV